MSNKIVTLLLALLMLLGMTAAMAEGEAITLTDMYDREITLTAPVTRVVALSAAECEIVCALGGEDTLVGRGEYCNYPASIADVPAVQSGFTTNIEEILALEPQVVIMTDMAQAKEQVKQLEDNGVKVVMARNTDIEGVYHAIAMIGALLGREAEAEAMVHDMRTAFEAIMESAENTGKTVYFEVSPLQWGLYTAGAGTFMDEIARMCGLTNAFADVEGWAAISEEQVLARNPDYIVSVSGMPEADAEIRSREGWAEVKAVAGGDVMNADADAFSRPGPRLKDAAESLYRFLESGEAQEEPAA